MILVGSFRHCLKQVRQSPVGIAGQKTHLFTVCVQPYPSGLFRALDPGMVGKPFNPLNQAA